MKKFFAVPLAVLFVAACSDSTSPVNSGDASPSYAKPTTPPPDNSGSLQNDTYNFDGSVVAAGSAPTGTVNVFSSSGSSIAAEPPTINPPLFPEGNNVLGSYASDGVTIETLNNESVEVSVPKGGTSYQVSFQLFIIGSWDGRGQQAQHGVFGTDEWTIGYRCVGSSTIVPIFTTTFSNQKTVQQNYPRPVGQGGGSPYLTGSEARDVLGFNTHVPSFESAADSRYDLTFSGTVTCTGAYSFVMSVPNFDLQSDYDESWTLDNLVVKTSN